MPIAEVVSYASGHLTGLADNPSVNTLLNNITGQITVVAMTLAGLMCVVLGIRVIASMKGGQSLREAIQNLGVLGLGIAIISGGTLILGAVREFVAAIK